MSNPMDSLPNLASEHAARVQEVKRLVESGQVETATRMADDLLGQLFVNQDFGQLACVGIEFEIYGHSNKVPEIHVVGERTVFIAGLAGDFTSRVRHYLADNFIGCALAMTSGEQDSLAFGVQSWFNGLRASGIQVTDDAVSIFSDALTRIGSRGSTPALRAATVLINHDLPMLTAPVSEAIQKAFAVVPPIALSPASKPGAGR